MPRPNVSLGIIDFLNKGFAGKGRSFVQGSRPANQIRIPSGSVQKGPSVLGVSGLDQGQVFRTPPNMGVRYPQGWSQEPSLDAIKKLTGTVKPSTVSSVSSNSSFQAMGYLGKMGVGAGLGAMSGLAGATVSGGNYGQGMMAGALLGGLGGAGHAFAAGKGFSMSTGKSMAGMIGLGGVGGGMMLSGRRGQDKRRGFNARRGNHVSSGAYR